jgi:hypothetical protein
MYPQYPQPTPRPRRRFNPKWLLGLIPACLACVVVIVIAIALVPRLLLQAIGFTPRGDVDTFWTEQLTLEPVARATPFLPPPPSGAVAQANGVQVTPTAVTLPGNTASDPAANPQPANTGGGGVVSEPYGGWFASGGQPASVVVGLQGGSSVTLNSDQPFADNALVGQGMDGYGLGVIQFQETDLGGICASLLRGCATDQYTVQRVDFRPGGAVIYAQVNVAGLSQEAGVALTLGADQKSFQAAGVVFNGAMYAIPPSGDIAMIVNDLVSRGNAALRDLRVQANGYNLSLIQMSVDETTLTLVLR